MWVMTKSVWGVSLLLLLCYALSLLCSALMNDDESILQLFATFIIQYYEWIIRNTVLVFTSLWIWLCCQQLLLLSCRRSVDLRIIEIDTLTNRTTYNRIIRKNLRKHLIFEQGLREDPIGSDHFISSVVSIMILTKLLLGFLLILPSCQILFGLQQGGTRTVHVDNIIRRPPDTTQRNGGGGENGYRLLTSKECRSISQLCRRD